MPYGSQAFPGWGIADPVLLSMTITSLYAVSEHAFYYGDYSRSHLLAVGKARERSSGPCASPAS
jgi:hypothetical protein